MAHRITTVERSVTAVGTRRDCARQPIVVPWDVTRCSLRISTTQTLGRVALRFPFRT